MVRGTTCTCRWGRLAHAVVDGDEGPLGAEARLHGARQQARVAEQLRQQLVGKVAERLVMVARNQQRVAREQRPDVEKGQRVAVLQHDARIVRAVHDLTELQPSTVAATAAACRAATSDRGFAINHQRATALPVASGRDHRRRLGHLTTLEPLDLQRRGLIRSGVGRLQLQPWPIRSQMPCRRSCHFATAGSWLRTCSRNSSRPPGRSTRSISARARSGSLTVQSTVSPPPCQRNRPRSAGSRRSEHDAAAVARTPPACASSLRAIGASGSASTSSSTESG